MQGLSDGTPVTVWRGTSVTNPECCNHMRTAISWTTDRDVAIWFANRLGIIGKNRGAVWEATIERSKIIAFTNDRDESEVIQHMNIKNPRMLNIPPNEWEAGVTSRSNKKE